MTNKRLARKAFHSFLIQSICVTLACIVIFPVVYCVFASFMGKSDLFSKNLIFVPSKPVLDNYETLFYRVNIKRYLFNSFVVSVLCSFSRVFFSSMAAYSLVFFNFIGKRIVFFGIVASIFIPQDLLFVQNYITISRLGLLNTYLGICSVYLVSAINIFMLRQAFVSYPLEIKDASFLDGCNNVSFFTKILIPTNFPVLTAVFFASFVSLWNIYLWPMVITNKDEMRTVQVAITILKGRDSPDFGPVMAAAFLSLIPSIILYILSFHFTRKSEIDSMSFFR